MTFNEKLKALMASKNVSMTQLANMTGITYNMIKNTATAERNPLCLMLSSLPTHWEFQ